MLLLEFNIFSLARLGDLWSVIKAPKRPLEWPVWMRRWMFSVDLWENFFRHKSHSTERREKAENWDEKFGNSRFLLTWPFSGVRLQRSGRGKGEIYYSFDLISVSQNSLWDEFPDMACGRKLRGIVNTRTVDVQLQDQRETQNQKSCLHAVIRS